MHILKSFFKVVNYYKVGIIIYAVIVMVMLVALTGTGSGNTDKMFQKKYTLYIVDNDKSAVSEAFIGYMTEKHYRKEGDLSDDQIRDLLYYQHISEYIVIPEGFGEAFLNTKDEPLSLIETMYDDSLPRGIFINMQMNEYLNGIRDYMNSGLSLEDADLKVKEATDIESFVTLKEKEASPMERPYTAFQFLPFGILSIIFSGVMPVILSFNDKEKKNRTMVSKLPMTVRNVMLILGAAILSVFVTVALVALATFGGPEYVFTREWWLSALNAFIYTISITFLLSMLTSLPLGLGKKGGANSTAFITNIIGLSFAFLGGTFVDLTILGDKVNAIGRFIPNYWYSVAARKIWYDGAGLQDLMYCFGLELLFGAVCLSIGLVFTKFFGEKAQ
ncbi:MAG: ABC transporter permease [Eubacterium sp.]|nr:ABC transporter permease [Eubacterium sp.]